MKKKLLIVHNFYREFGGEDANIREEINFLVKNTTLGSSPLTIILN